MFDAVLSSVVELVPALLEALLRSNTGSNLDSAAATAPGAPDAYPSVARKPKEKEAFKIPAPVAWIHEKTS